EGRRGGLVQGGRHLGLDIHAQRQDRRRRDHQPAAEIIAEGRRRCASRAAGKSITATRLSCDTVARPGLGWYQRAPWLKNPKNPRNSAPACRAGWKIVARRRLPRHT